jgi:hypothetical protein
MTEEEIIKEEKRDSGKSVVEEILNDCPQCKQKTLKCQYAGDVGGSFNYVDRYTAQCSNKECGYIGQEEIYGGNTSSANYFTKCPFCDVFSDKHN